MLKFPQTTVDPRSGYYVSEYGILSIYLARTILVGTSKVTSVEESFLLPGRSARVYVGGEHMGCLGIVHPEVLAYYELTCPCALLELDIQQFESYTSTCVAWSGQSQSGLK
ncbi:hypothetical protein Zmor_019087 [Zophobas morio]|uniref:Phenylalanyl tRNA synthetase beta chain core domain-containing protein n=1 Tax=Zophobas morio TaxID=2755281 RepID=A0AA38HIZ5_9CUCU|nr:hypothetical protein Zmor_019087 [Zophobas morio]